MIALNSQKIYPPLSWRVNSNYLPNVIRPTLVCEICYSFDLLIVLHQNQLIILVHIKNICWLQLHPNDIIMSGSLFVLQAHIFCNALIDSSAAFTIFFSRWAPEEALPLQMTSQNTVLFASFVLYLLSKEGPSPWKTRY